MSTLRKPTLGPIIGHTTHDSCRLWIADSEPGDMERKETAFRRTVGVLGVLGANGKVDEKHIYYFRMKRSHDRTGTFVLGKDTGIWGERLGESDAEIFQIRPETDYTIRMSVLTLDDALDDDHVITNDRLGGRLPHPSSWEEVLNDMPDAYVEAKVTTFPAPPPETSAAGKGDFSFLLGSCRYPGIMWKRKQADRIFGPMLEDHKTSPGPKEPVKFALMVGDQIYADMFNRFIPVGLATTYEEFQERYHSAFGSRNMRNFLSNIPTYMILDDHEIEDNWTQDRILEDKKRRIFNLAIGAYMSYQWCHGPRSWGNCYVEDPEEGYTKTEERLFVRDIPTLYYDFLCQGYPFFVLDGRTQRFKDEEEGLDDNHMLGRPSLHPSEPNQLDRLLSWLKNQQIHRGNTPKFIVSASVFVPNPVDSLREKKKEKSDSWPAYPKTRRAILDCIVENGIENVIFLSGDIHNSNVARMSFSGGPSDGLTAYSITSSAFYWPFPFADGEPSNYVHDSKEEHTWRDLTDTFELSDGNGQMDYVAWGFTQADNFARVDVEKSNNRLVVRVMGRDGESLVTTKSPDPRSARNRHPQRLKLAPW